MKFRYKKIAALFAAVTAISALGGCGEAGIRDYSTLDGGKEISTVTTTAETKAPEDIQKKSKTEVSDGENPQDNTQSSTSVCSLVCVGDNLIHDNIYNEALSNGGGTEYDFTKAYENVEKYIKDTDVAIVNAESLITDECEPESYPTFATPTADGDKLVDMGFNVVSMSNNHVLDQGESGLISSLDYWDTKDVVHYGAYRSEEDAEDIKTMEVNGITFAFLGYTEYTNCDLTDFSNAEVFYLSDEETLKNQIQAADEIADVVVVSCHYGTEVENELNEQQEELTPKMVEWGADLIIGTQAHTVSTCGYIDKADGSKAFVYYGLGNFIGTMDEPKSQVGLIGKLNVVKNNDTGAVSFEDVKAIPIISHFEGEDYYGEWTNCTVYPYSEYTDELFEKHFGDDFTRQTVEECLSFVPSEFLSIE